MYSFQTGRPFVHKVGSATEDYDALYEQAINLSQSGGQQRVESGYTALFHHRDIHAAHHGRLPLRTKVPGKVTEVVVFIDGTCGSEDETWRFVKPLLCLVIERLATGNDLVGVREHNITCIRPGYCCDTPFGVTLVEDV